MSEFLYDKVITPRTDQEQKSIVNRLKRIEGQVRGIQKMIEEDRYCIDILVQISAIQAALRKASYSITERHMKHCVTHAIETGDGETAIDELLEVMKQFSK